ncbi:MAG: hypothetical protein QXF59_05715 [Candidatus Bathyarchaeia archaeon]
MEYEVLNPCGEVDPLPLRGLNPRVKSLDGVTVGLFAGFKGHWFLILKEVARQLETRFPSTKFSFYEYPKDCVEIEQDDEYRPSFESWLKGVDTVISGHGDAASCALFLAYNTALAEKLGKPAVMLTNKAFENICKSGASARGVPALRLVLTDIPDLSPLPDLEPAIEKIIKPGVSAVINEVVTALTKPLSPEEEFPVFREEKLPRIVFKGNLEEVNAFFYRRGWSYGMPIIPPTEETVKEMLKGTDLPPDYVVARIPPKMGKATVEKIAINAVMAGCLPTHMPVLIAAVQAITDPKVWGKPSRALEAYTCSVAGWGHLLIVNGPARRDMNIHSGGGLMSPYYKANVSIGLALGLILRNIGGVRPGIEDMAVLGHELRYCIAENEEESPWEPLHVQRGFKKEDNTVTVFWPGARYRIFGFDADTILRSMCEVPVRGWNPTCAFIISPAAAKALANEGWTRKEIVSYLVEYARMPAAQVNWRWMRDNKHLWGFMERGIPVPKTTDIMRKFFDPDNILIVVAGASYYAPMVLALTDGDHGGPITKKIELPSNWDKLVEKYKDLVPKFALL